MNIAGAESAGLDTEHNCGEAVSDAHLYGSIKLPLPAVFASALWWEVTGAIDGKTVSIGDLCDHGFVSALSMSERELLGVTVTNRLQQLMRDSAVPKFVADMKVSWTPYMLGLVGKPARERLRAGGWGERTATVIIKSLLPQLGSDVSALVRLMMRGRSPSPEADEQAVDAGAADRQDAKQKKAQGPYNPMPPTTWKPSSADASTVYLEDGGSISTTDPRFGWTLHLLLSDVDFQCTTLEELGELTHARGKEGALLIWDQLIEGIGDAKSLTAEHEIESILRACMRRSRDPGRSVKMVMARYGSDGTPRSLDEVGDLFMITRQSVLHTVQLGMRSCFRGVFAPGLDSLLDHVEASGEGGYVTVEVSMRAWLGTRQSLDGAVQFARDFLARKCTLNLVRSTKRRGKDDQVQWWSRGGEEFLPAVIAVARSLTASTGACHWAAVTATVSEQISNRVTRKQFEVAIDAHPKGVWLDRAQGWAAFSDIDESGLLQDARLVLSIASPCVVSLQELYEGVCRSDMQRAGDTASGESTAYCAPPAWVFARLLGSRGEIRCGSDGYSMVCPDPQAEAQVGRGIDRIALGAIRAHGGAIDWGSLRDEMKAAGLDVPNLRQAVQSMPFVREVGSGGISLRGRQLIFSAAAEMSATQAVELNRGSKEPVRLVVERSLEPIRVVLQQSKATVVPQRNRIVYIPSSLTSVLHGRFAAGGSNNGDIEIVSNRVRGLSVAAAEAGFAPGASFAEKFNVTARSYEIEAT